ncbi:hypothetical protein I204_07287 [Kwoniella mangroviensis CBS 8886]|nr:hypothetical protein I204_07287 [Kwoniella mangroviensis CBS 8886]
MYCDTTQTPLTPPPSYRSSPTPSIGSTTSRSSRSSFSYQRYSPYPRMKMEQEDGGEMEVLRDIRDVRLEEYRRNSQKARSTSPYDGLPTARPKLSTIASASEKRNHRNTTHRRAYSMSTISYGYFLFPSQKQRPSQSPPILPSTPRPIPAPFSYRQYLPRRAQTSSPLPISSVTKSSTRPSIPSPPSRGSTPTPNPSKSNPPTRKLILVNPIVANHLKHGGMVNLRSVDGQKSFKVYLPPRMGGVEMVRGLATSSAC